jgi:hypothetical protein
MAKRTPPPEAGETDEEAPHGIEEAEEALEGDAEPDDELAGAEGTIERPTEPDDDEAEEDDELEARHTDEDASDAEEGPAQGVAAATGEAAEEAPVAAEPEPMEWPEDVPVPTLGSDDEYTAYLCGYRAGETDPGYLLMLAEVGRHLGSFFTEEEAEAFGRMPGDQWWQRWGLGYIDATQKRIRRPRSDDMWEDEESGS